MNQTQDSNLSDRSYAGKLRFATYSPVVSLSLLIASLLAMVCLLMWAMRWVDHTNRVIEQAWYVQKLTVDLQASMRGYLLTGDEQFLSPYRESNEQLTTAMRDLQIVVGDNPRQLGRVVRMQHRLEDWLTWSGQVFRSSDPNSGLHPTTQTLREGSTQFEGVRSDLSKFIAEENELRQQRSDRVRSLTRVGLISASVLTTLVAIWQCRMVRRRVNEVTLNYRNIVKLARERRERIRELLRSLDKELQAVGEIQRSLLPIEVPAVEGLDLAASYQTSSRAGGDYFDFFILPPSTPGGPARLGILIADVSGHGTPAAVLMAVTHSIAHGFDQPQRPPSDLLSFVNRRLCLSYTNSNVSFVTAFYGIYDPATRVLNYSSAGHNPPRLRDNSRAWTELLEAQGLPLGVMHEAKYKTRTVQLQPGDMLVFYTDGITEARNPEGEFFGVQRIDELIDAENGNTHFLLQQLLARVKEFAGTEVSDDQTLLLMSILDGTAISAEPRHAIILGTTAPIAV